MRFPTVCCLSVACLGLCLQGLSAAEPCTSGLEPGRRPGPYSSVVATGPQRGQSYCFICETADRPAVVVFARSLSAPLGKLVHEIDQPVVQHQAAGLCAWVTFLSDDQPGLDPEVVKWARRHAIGTVPLAVFDNTDGPASYRLSRDADVTVLLFVKRRVVANYAFRTGELNEEGIAAVLKNIPSIIDDKR